MVGGNLAGPRSKLGCGEDTGVIRNEAQGLRLVASRIGYDFDNRVRDGYAIRRDDKTVQRRTFAFHHQSQRMGLPILQPCRVAESKSCELARNPPLLPRPNFIDRDAAVAQQPDGISRPKVVIDKLQVAGQLDVAADVEGRRRSPSDAGTGDRRTRLVLDADLDLEGRTNREVDRVAATEFDSGKHRRHIAGAVDAVTSGCKVVEDDASLLIAEAPPATILVELQEDIHRDGR